MKNVVPTAARCGREETTMFTPRRTTRLALAALAVAVALPALAQDDGGPPPPPPPEELPWAAPEAPPPRRARPPQQRPQPVYRPDAAYPPRQVERQRPPPADWYEPGEPAPRPEPRRWYPQLELAFRTGVASPGGDAAEGLPMADLFGEQVTLGVELGVRSTPHLHVGFFAEGGVGQAGRVSGCLAGSCDSSSASGRLGVGLRWHLAPYAPIDPWFGYGVAVSGATVSGDDAYGSFSRTLTGVEYAKVSAGVDLKLSRRAALGVYAEWTSGVFTSMEDREDGAVVDSGRLAGTTTHRWFTVGPRLRF